MNSNWLAQKREMPPRFRSGRNGFTLVELLVVIGIISILAAIVFPVFAAVREQGRKTVCLSNERQLGIAVLQYVTDYDEQFPPSDEHPGTHWASTCYAYVRNTSVYKCPDDTTLPLTPTNALPEPVVSYGFNSNLGGKLWVPPPNSDAIPGSLPILTSPSKTVLLFDVSGVTAELPPLSGQTWDGSAAGNGGIDCGPSGQSTYPCGPYFLDSKGQELPSARYETGDIGGKVLNGGAGSQPRHRGGANYVASDGHSLWLAPQQVSGGKAAVAEDCQQGAEQDQPADCRGQTASQAAGTASSHYKLTFSSR